jgi:hypothetical protein
MTSKARIRKATNGTASKEKSKKNHKHMISM